MTLDPNTPQIQLQNVANVRLGLEKVMEDAIKNIDDFINGMIEQVGQGIGMAVNKATSAVGNAVDGALVRASSAASSVSANLTPRASEGVSDRSPSATLARTPSVGIDTPIVPSKPVDWVAHESGISPRDWNKGKVNVGHDTSATPVALANDVGTYSPPNPNLGQQRYSSGQGLIA